jgi:hypothetical protein
MTDPDHHLEERLRRLRPSSLPGEVQARLTHPPVREAGARRRITRMCFIGTAAAAAAFAIFWNKEPATVSNEPAAPVLADTTGRRVEDARPLAVLAEGLRAWELVEVKWVDESTLTSTAEGPLAVQASNTYRTIVPVEIVLD